MRDEALKPKETGLSSNASFSLPVFAPLSRNLQFVTGINLVLAAPLAAQDDASVTNPAQSSDEEAIAQAPPAPPERLILDLSVTVPKDESDVLIENDCEEENDAARITNEIIVCRDLGEATDGSFDKTDWAKRYAEKTKGGSTPDVAGGGIFRGKATVSGQCFIPPCPPPPALLIDVEALPEAPDGSDADRIARGLPPLGQDEELGEEEIRKRREALGLPPPTYEQPE